MAVAVGSAMRRSSRSVHASLSLVLTTRPDSPAKTTAPNGLNFMRVRIEDVAEADAIFTKLMGDVVEPRHEFIQANALRVEHLDF